MQKNMVSIILPSKDEKNLPNVVNRLKKILSCHYEIIIVIGDKNKYNIPLSLFGAEHIKFKEYYIFEHIKIFKSYGDSLERAILLGFSVAKGSKIIVMDADGSHTPKTVPQMIKELNTHEMVIASRFIKNSTFKTTPFRRFVTWFFNSYARLLGSTLTDPMSGFFGIRSDLLKEIRFKPFKWKIALEISNKTRPKTKEVPFNFLAFNKNRTGIQSLKIGLKILWDIMVSAL